MSDKPKQEETPKVEKVEKVMSAFQRWTHILTEAIEGVGWLGGIFAFLGLSHFRGMGSREGQTAAHGERSGPSSLLDEYFILNALFGSIKDDRELEAIDIQNFLIMLKASKISGPKRRKLFHLIGLEVDTVTEDIAAGKKVSKQVNAMGRKIILGLNDLGPALAIKLLTDTPILENPIDTVHGWLKSGWEGVKAIPMLNWLQAVKRQITAANIPAKTRVWLDAGIAKTENAILWQLDAADLAEAEHNVVAREQEVARVRAQTSYERNLKGGTTFTRTVLALVGIIVLSVVIVAAHS